MQKLECVYNIHDNACPNSDEDEFNVLSEYVEYYCDYHISFYRGSLSFVFSPIQGDIFPENDMLMVETGNVIKILSTWGVEDRTDYVHYNENNFYSMRTKKGFDFFVSCFIEEVFEFVNTSDDVKRNICSYLFRTITE